MESYDWLFDDSSTEVHQAEESSDEPVWVTGKGDKIPLSKMTNSHIGNCINMLKVRGRSAYEEKWLTIFRNEYLRRLNTPIEGGFTL